MKVHDLLSIFCKFRLTADSGLIIRFCAKSETEGKASLFIKIVKLPFMLRSHNCRWPVAGNIVSALYHKL